MLRALKQIFLLSCVGFCMFYVAVAQDNINETASPDVYQEKANELIETMQTPELKKLLEDALSKAEQGGLDYEEMQADHDKAMKLLKREKGIDFQSPQPSNVSTEEGELIVFLSLSMPEKLILEYMKEAETLNARLVIQGIVEGDLGETVKRMRRLMGDTQQNVRGVSIDHRSFAYHGVTRVPTIILSEHSLLECIDESCPKGLGKVDKISGAVSLDYALNQFASRGDNPHLAKARLEATVQ